MRRSLVLPGLLGVALVACAQEPTPQPMAPAPPPVVVEKKIVERPAPPPTIIVKETPAPPPKVIVIEKAAASPCEGLPESGCRTREGCAWVAASRRQSGTPVDAYCRVSMANARAPAVTTRGGNCHWVSGYTRKDGTSVRGHRRCR